MSVSIFSDFVDQARPFKILQAGEMLFQRGSAVEQIFLIAGGSVKLSRYQADGKELVLQISQANALIAEASVYSRIYHCDAQAIDGATILAIGKSAFLLRLEQDLALARRWSAYLAGELQNARHRNELLGRNKVDDRLAGWLDWHGQLPPKGQRKALAAQLGVTPEALYRAIAKLPAK